MAGTPGSGSVPSAVAGRASPAVAPATGASAKAKAPAEVTAAGPTPSVSEEMSMGRVTTAPDGSPSVAAPPTAAVSSAVAGESSNPGASVPKVALAEEAAVHEEPAGGGLTPGTSKPLTSGARELAVPEARLRPRLQRRTVPVPQRLVRAREKGRSAQRRSSALNGGGRYSGMPTTRTRGAERDALSISRLTKGSARRRNPSGGRSHAIGCEEAQSSSVPGAATRHSSSAHGLSTGPEGAPTAEPFAHF